MDILLGIILSTLASMGLSTDMADSCMDLPNNSSAVQVPCPPPVPTDSTDSEGTGLIKVGGSGLIKVGGSG